MPVLQMDNCFYVPTNYIAKHGLYDAGFIIEALLGVLGIRDNWENYLGIRDNWGPVRDFNDKE